MHILLPNTGYLAGVLKKTKVKLSGCFERIHSPSWTSLTFKFYSSLQHQQLLLFYFKHIWEYTLLHFCFSFKVNNNNVVYCCVNVIDQFFTTTTWTRGGDTETLTEHSTKTKTFSPVRGTLLKSSHSEPDDVKSQSRKCTKPEPEHYYVVNDPQSCTADTDAEPRNYTDVTPEPHSDLYHSYHHRTLSCSVPDRAERGESPFTVRTSPFTPIKKTFLYVFICFIM